MRTGAHNEHDISLIELVNLQQQLQNVKLLSLALRTVRLVANGDNNMFKTVAKAWHQLLQLWLIVKPILSTSTFLTLSAFPTQLSFDSQAYSSSR